MKIQLNDAVQGLHSLQKESVSLLLSDLPSGETRAPFDKKADLKNLWPATWTALKPTGIACFMASSLKFASELRASQLRSFRYEIIWRKSLATGHLNARTRPLRSHEYILLFWRKGSTCYHPQMWESDHPIHAATQTSLGQNYGPRTKVARSRAGATDRYPISVLDFASVGTSASDRIHPQQKPIKLMKWLIATYSQPGDLVVDPYAGSGSTGLATEQLGRRFIGFDSCPRFALL